MSQLEFVDRGRTASLATLRGLGIDGTTAATLLDAFDDLDEIQDASRRELASVDGVGPATRDKIKRSNDQ